MTITDTKRIYTDSEIVDLTACLLFAPNSNDEIDPWEVYDKLESLFSIHRLNLKKKYDINTDLLNSIKAKKEEIKANKEHLLELEQELTRLEINLNNL